jgi:hypothetical protein
MTVPACANVMLVNRDSGRIAWVNSTGHPLEVAAYTLRSASGGLVPNEWLSIAENYDADSGGGIDEDDTWFILGSETFSLSEGTFGTTSISAGAALDLGNAWTPGHEEDLTFNYLDADLNEVLEGNVFFISTIAGDYNANGFVEQGDLDLVLLHWGQLAVPPPQSWLSDLPVGIVDQEELDRVLLNWGTIGPFSTPPVAATVHVAIVPEPSSLLLVMAAVCALARCVVRKAGGADPTRCGSALALQRGC